MSYRYFIVLIAFFGFILGSCNKPDLNEVKETSDPVELLVTAVSEVYSTFDVMDDLLSTSELVRKKDELLIPNSVSIVFQDNDFLDGDGIEFSINFGGMGSEAPYGVLCKDQKYRAGLIHVKISGRYGNPDTEIEILMDEDDPFYSGNGESMTKLTGLFIVRKLEAQALSFKTEDLEITVEDQALQFTCDNTVSKVHDAGLGIFKDEISIDGEFSIKLGDQVSYDAYILKSLKKVYDPGCVRNILSGVITLNPAASSSDLSADFDPYQDEACDNLVRITINGKSTIYAY